MGIRLKLTICIILNFATLVRLLVIDKRPPSFPRYLHPFEEELEAALWLDENDERITNQANTFLQAKWDFVTNITSITKANYVVASTNFMLLKSQLVAEIEDNFPSWESFQNKTLRRAFYFMIKENYGNNSQVLDEMNQILAGMEEAHGTSKVCEYETRDGADCKLLKLVPDIEAKLRLAESVNESEYYWTAWHDQVGSQVPQTDFQSFVDIQNQIARLNGLEHMGEKWTLPYLSEETGGWPSANAFKEAMDTIWNENFKEPYEILHEYVRMKLRENQDYHDLIGEDGTLPANLLGNIWSQDWGSLASTTKPFPDENILDLTAEMEAKGFEAYNLLEIPAGYLVSLGGGLDGLPDEWWTNSKYENLPDNAECYPMTQDYRTTDPGDSTNLRIKICTQVDDTYFIEAFRKLLNLNYFLKFDGSKSYLPHIFRRSAIPGVLDAVGGTAALSAMTPCSLRQSGLNGETVVCESGPHNTTSNYSCNNLYLVALKLLPTIASTYVLDTWRWKVYAGETQVGSFNREFWNLRREIMRIVPPAGLDKEEKQLDAAAYYAVSGNVEIFKDFISHILQFQMYENICKNMGFYPAQYPLHECNFFTYYPEPQPWKQEDVGQNFVASMRKGFSEPWEKVFQNLTGGPINADIFASYIGPLREVLEDKIGPKPPTQPDASTTESPTATESSAMTDSYGSTTIFSTFQPSTIVTDGTTIPHTTDITESASESTDQTMSTVRQSTSEFSTTDSSTAEDEVSTTETSSTTEDEVSTTQISSTTEDEVSTIETSSTTEDEVSTTQISSTTEDEVSTTQISSTTEDEVSTTQISSTTEDEVSTTQTSSTDLDYTAEVNTTPIFVTATPKPIVGKSVSLEIYVVGSILAGGFILLMLLHHRKSLRWQVELPCEEPW